MFRKVPVLHGGIGLDGISDGLVDGSAEIDGDSDGHVIPNWIEVSFDMKSPPSLIRTESKNNLYAPFPLNQSQQIPSSDESVIVKR